MVELGAIYRLWVSVCTNVGNAAVRRPYKPIDTIEKNHKDDKCKKSKLLKNVVVQFI